MTDNAKELLTRLDRWIEHFGKPVGNGRANPDNDMIYLLSDCRDALRLSVETVLAVVVRQADSVYADERNDIQDRRAIRRFADRYRLNSDDPDTGWAARALLAKYDIFEKVEG